MSPRDMAVSLYGLVENNLPRMAQFREAFAQVAGSGQFILGPAVADFERDLAEYIGCATASAWGRAPMR